MKGTVFEMRAQEEAFIKRTSSKDNSYEVCLVEAHALERLVFELQRIALGRRFKFGRGMKCLLEDFVVTRQMRLKPASIHLG